MLARQIEQKTAAAHRPSSQKVTHPNQTNKEPSRTPEKHQQNTTKPPANSYRKHKATLSTSHTTLTKSHQTLNKSHKWADHQPTLIKSSKNLTKTQQKPNKIPPKPKQKSQKLGKPAQQDYTLENSYLNKVLPFFCQHFQLLTRLKHNNWCVTTTIF